MVDKKVDSETIGNGIDKKIKCMFCHRTLAVVGENGDPKGIEIRCPKCKKLNRF